MSPVDPSHARDAQRRLDEVHYERGDGMCVAPAAGKVTFAGAVHSTASESGVAHIESADSPQDVRLRPALTITDKRRSSTSAALSIDRRLRQTLVYPFVNYR